MAVIEMDLVDYLPMTSEWTTMPVGGVLTAVVVFQDSFTTNRITSKLEETLTLYDSFIVTNGDLSAMLSDSIQFVDAFKREPLTAIWYDSLGFDDSFGRLDGHNDVLTFVDSWVGVYGTPINNTLAFTSTYTTTIERNRVVEDELAFASNFVAYLNDKYSSNIPLPVIGGPNPPQC